MARTTPVNQGYLIINGTTTGAQGSVVDTWIEYKILSQSSTDNTSLLHVLLYSQSRSNSSVKWEYPERFGYVGYDDLNREYYITNYDFSNSRINCFADHVYTVQHDSDGRKTIVLQGAWSTSHSDEISGGSASGTVYFPQIQRPASVTQGFNAIYETSAILRWTSDEVIDYLWYSRDGGETFTGVDIADGKTGTIYISSLTADTDYNIVVEYRKKSNQYITRKSNQIHTYAYPYANNMPNFTIGNQLTVKIYNPLQRTVQLSMLGADDSVIQTDTINGGDTLSGWTSSTIINKLYQSIPSSASGTYKIRVTYGTHIETRTGGTYSINPSQCTPTIGSVSYRDTRNATIALTGNDQEIVRNQSIVAYTAGSFTTKYSSVVGVSVTVNGTVYPLTLSGSSASGTGGTIDSRYDLDVTFTVKDARGVTGTKTLRVEMIDWYIPNAIITCHRENNFYTPTYLKVDAQYAYINGNNHITITYSATKEGDQSPSVTGTLQDNVQATVNLDNNYNWDVVFTLTDALGTATYNYHISQGTPIIYFDRIKSSVGVNCFPNGNHTLEISGDVIINGKKLIFNNNNTVTWTNA
jgi:hypothetical protein